MASDNGMTTMHPLANAVRSVAAKTLDSAQPGVHGKPLPLTQLKSTNGCTIKVKLLLSLLFPFMSNT
jgi:hypothetical protein